MENSNMEEKSINSFNANKCDLSPEFNFKQSQRSELVSVNRPNYAIKFLPEIKSMCSYIKVKMFHCVMFAYESYAFAFLPIFKITFQNIFFPLNPKQTHRARVEQIFVFVCVCLCMFVSVCV